jgi:hypothetical protein
MPCQPEFMSVRLFADAIWGEAKMDELLLNKLLLITQIATLIALIVYVIKTWHIASATKESAEASKLVLEEMRESRDQETAPYVVAYFDELPNTQNIFLIVKNIGKSIALNVKLEFDPSLENVSSQHKVSNIAFIKDGISSMPPGYEIKTFFDNAAGYFSKNLPLIYKVKISYIGGVKSTERFYEQIMDLSALKGLIYLDPKEKK